MRKKKELPKVEPVQLKPMFGMKPGVWLTILYALILVLFIFFTGIVPDLVHGFERVSFTSDSYNTAVYIDSNYAGGTPFTVKVPSGEHTVVYKVNGVEIDSMQIKVGKPVFYNWLFPRTMKVNSSAVLNKEACTALTKEFFSDLASYSAITEYDSVHIYPPLYTDYVKTVLPSGLFDQKTFKLALLFATSDEMIADAKQALELAGMTYDFSALKAVSGVGSSVYGSAVSCEKTTLNAGSIKLDGWKITTSTGKSFCIAETEVSEALWAAFKNSSSSASEVRPVRNISYNEALEFCSWLSKLSGKNVRLPSEAEWETAAQFSNDGYQSLLVSLSDAKGPHAMLGGVWEMTSSFYVPLTDSVSDGAVQNLIKELGSECEIVVKGGSYVNSASKINILTRGAAPTDLCSEYLGLRIVWD